MGFGAKGFFKNDDGGEAEATDAAESRNSMARTGALYEHGNPAVGPAENCLIVAPDQAADGAVLGNDKPDASGTRAHEVDDGLVAGAQDAVVEDIAARAESIRADDDSSLPPGRPKGGAERKHRKGLRDDQCPVDAAELSQCRQALGKLPVVSQARDRVDGVGGQALKSVDHLAYS